ncbi:MAG: hypothetical protein M1129_04590 [Candidatus Thermoplasmatota archaeon]|jgi:hypothetical protein|nr:hypothetical protein [Candidatus Thermoplasmatota archaeon]MCL5955399.1 hypothetical protein [Candidatus Thermoplasmatota archaeon]
MEKDTEKEENENEESKQNISVKGVRKDIYGRIMKLTRDTGQTLGEITNEAYRTFLSGVEGAKHLSKNFIDGATKGSVKYIENIKTLTINGEDLAEISTKIVFRNIDTLIFEDISTEDVTKHVESLSNVKVIVIPKSVSKASILLRSTLIDEIRISK